MSDYETEYSFESRRRYDAGSRNDMVGALTDAVRENPVSAALIGMGALWLFMGGGSMPLFGGRGRTSLAGSVASGAGSVAHGASDMVRGTAHAIGQMGSSVASGVSSTVGGLAETASDTASRMGEYVSGSFGGVDAERAYRNPSFTPDQTGNGSFDTDRWGASRPSPMAGMRSGMQDLLERHPIALGVAGLALGAGIAASLPLTSQERETLGKANEAVRSKLSEAADQAKDMASAMADELSQPGRSDSLHRGS